MLDRLAQLRTTKAHCFTPTSIVDSVYQLCPTRALRMYLGERYVYTKSLNSKVGTIKEKNTNKRKAITTIGTSGQPKRHT